MANHPDPGGPGANAVLKRLRVARDGFPVDDADAEADPAASVLLRHRTRRYYVARAVLRPGASRPRAFGLDRDEVWLRAARDIAAGEPILLSYASAGTGALRALLGIPHRTVPALSAVCAAHQYSRKRAT
jgi:hypothetical protein